MPATLPYVGIVPDYRIEDGNMVISCGDWFLVMPLRIFEQGLARSARVIAEYHARSAEIVPFRRDGG